MTVAILLIQFIFLGSSKVLKKHSVFDIINGSAFVTFHPCDKMDGGSI